MKITVPDSVVDKAWKIYWGSSALGQARMRAAVIAAIEEWVRCGGAEHHYMATSEAATQPVIIIRQEPGNG